MIQYFAYGSNMDLDDLARWCEKRNKKALKPNSIKPVVLPGYKLVFNHYSETRKSGAANIMESSSDNVWGLLMEITDEDIATIQDKEGFPNTYDEKKVIVKDKAGNIIENVLTYKIKPGKEKSKHQPPVKEYLGFIINNGIKYGFPEEYIAMLKNMKKKYIDDNQIIWRYFTTSKFLSMIISRKLFFARSDMFTDKMEGLFIDSDQQSNDIQKYKRLGVFINCW